MKTPGVFIIEQNAFPNSVVEVATAVSAFVGYTERADNQGQSLLMKPVRITSLAEYQKCFGSAPEASFDIVDAGVADEDADFQAVVSPEGKTTNHRLEQTVGRYLLYACMRLFFMNGGGRCYVVSVGTFGKPIDAAELVSGIETLVQEHEPTLIVVPDCVLLKGAGSAGADPGDCISVQQAMLKQCGEMRNRFAILDLWGGWQAQDACVPAFRDAIGLNGLDFAAAYYPWLHTTLVEASDLSYRQFTPQARVILMKLLQAEGDMTVVDGDEKLLHDALMHKSVLYRTIVSAMLKKLNLLPPSAAMAGVYTRVDNDRGVWKAPANVSLFGVVDTAVTLSQDDQKDLNVTPQGKSINAIRTVVGEGVLVWGARTLDGNSLDWRYINVRRTMIMLEESCRQAAKAMVFEPNVANTWVMLKSMIANFLTGIWKRGGLAGAVPDDAFSVRVGLGETMTPQDIIEGILRVTVLVAIVRPGEFIEFTFEQQMQKS